MDAHQMVTTLLSIVAFFGGWIMHSFRAQLNDNRNDIKETSDRVHAVEVLVAGKYVTREELAAHTETVLKKLDTIQGDIRLCMLHKRRKDDACEE